MELELASERVLLRKGLRGAKTLSFAPPPKSNTWLIFPVKDLIPLRRMFLKNLL